MKGLSSVSLRRSSIVLFSLLFFSLSSFARAEAPMVKTQAPGFYRMMVGSFEVTVLYDGYVALNDKLLKNTTEKEIRKLHGRMFVVPGAQTSVNTYLINTGSKLVMVDAGAGGVFGPTMGRVMSNLKAAGYDPAQVDAVVITHLHGDHVGGLLDAAGKPSFPNAVVYVAKAESDFWTAPASEEKAPAEYKKFFKMTRDLAAPFVAAGTWKTFENGATPVAGIKSIPIPGHTPGHTAYEIGEGKEMLLVTGDMVHDTAVQFARPRVAISFDTNPKKAVEVRLALFKKAAAGKTLIAGMHLPFPGIGHIRADGKDTYAYVPVDYTVIVENAKPKTAY